MRFFGKSLVYVVLLVVAVSLILAGRENTRLKERLKAAEVSRAEFTREAHVLAFYMFEGLPTETLKAAAAYADWQVVGRQPTIMPENPVWYFVRAYAALELYRRENAANQRKSVAPELRAK